MEAVHQFTLSIAQEVDRIVIYVRGELDFSMSSRLIMEVERALRDGIRACVFDFESVTFIDSEIVKSLLDIRHRLNEYGVMFYLQNCNAQVNRIITILGLQRWLLYSAYESSMS